MRKILFFVTLMSALYCMPAFGQESIDYNKVEPNFEAAIKAASDTTTKYVKTGLNIRQEPTADAAILGLLDPGSEVEVVAEMCGWSCIVLDTGVLAYVSTEYLSDFPIANRWGVILTEAEIDVLNRIVMLEAGGESIEGQQAVTEVILNRVADPDYPDTIIKVLRQKGQFSTWKNRHIAVADPSEEVKESVQAVLNGETDILPFETVYFSRGAQNSRIEKKIGKHVFCNK